MNIALISSHAKLFESLRQSLSAYGSNCTRFDDGLQLARTARREAFDAVIVDARAGLDAVRPTLERCARIGGRPVALLVAGLSSDGIDLELAFELGADDVVVAPIDEGELLARTRCAARRVKPALASSRQDEVIVSGAHRLDRGTGRATVDAVPIALTGREFALAWFLFTHRGEVVTRREIACDVWFSSEDIVGRTLEQHIYKLRKKLCLQGSHGLQLSTLYGRGYQLEAADVLRVAPGLAAELFVPGAARAAPRDASVLAVRAGSRQPPTPPLSLLAA